jgi:hypothetical protein
MHMTSSFHDSPPNMRWPWLELSTLTGTQWIAVRIEQKTTVRLTGTATQWHSDLL